MRSTTWQGNLRCVHCHSAHHKNPTKETQLLVSQGKYSWVELWSIWWTLYLCSYSVAFYKSLSFNPRKINIYFLDLLPRKFHLNTPHPKNRQIQVQHLIGEENKKKLRITGPSIWASPFAILGKHQYLKPYTVFTLFIRFLIGLFLVIRYLIWVYPLFS